MDGIDQKFRIRLLGDGDKPYPYELDIGVYSVEHVWLVGEEKVVTFSPPLVDRILQLQHLGKMPHDIVVGSLEAEVTTTLAVAIGQEVPEDVCTASMFATRVGIHVLSGTPYEEMMKAYYGFINSSLEETGGNQVAALIDSINFWTEIVYDPLNLELLAGLWNVSSQCKQFGIEGIYDLEDVCLIWATGPALSVGFEYANTVILANIDGEGSLRRVSIGTIAEDKSFMTVIHQNLYNREKKRCPQHNDSPPIDCSWILVEDEYIKSPEQGTLLSLEAIVNIVMEYITSQ